MKKCLSQVVVLVFSLFIVSVASAKEGDVVYFSFEQFYQHSKVMNELQHKMSNKFKKMRQPFMEKNKRREALIAELNNISHFSSSGLKNRREELDKLQSELSKEGREFQRAAQEMVEDNRMKTNALIAKVVKAVAEEKKYSLVINATPEGSSKQLPTLAQKVVLFTDGRYDVTPEIISVFDQKISITQLIK